MIFKNPPLILAYHSISRNRKDALSVSAIEFEKQLKWLKNKNYKVVTIEEAIRMKNQKSAVITFDDGYRDNYEIAFPILKKYGFNATIFIATDFIGTEKIYHWDKDKIGLHGDEEDFKILNWDQIIEMKKHGINFGSHTQSHRVLTDISLDESKKEILKSKQILEKKIHSDINLFCYPEGKMNDHIIKQVENAGYDYGVVTPPVKGIPNSKYALRRVGIYQNTTMFQFKLKTIAIVQKLIEYTKKDHYQ